MQDIQSSADDRGIEIQRVGVSGVRLPFSVKMKEGGFQEVQADIRFTVSLPKEYKGTHMSRFLEILDKWGRKPLAGPEMSMILDDALEKLAADSARLEIKFKYFIKKEAPVSGRMSYLDLDCEFCGTKRAGEPLSFELGVALPATSLCPCSKAISRYGAHNQRGMIRARVRFADVFDCLYIEDLACLMEAQASCPIYPLLKREDEKYVTEYAYDHPKFVEDILRDLVLAMRKLRRLEWFSVSCENFESIHNHSAYASHEELLIPRGDSGA